MTAFALLFIIITVVVAGLIWLARMLSTEQPHRNPPRHAEDDWSVNGLPSHPYAVN